MFPRHFAAVSLAFVFAPAHAVTVYSNDFSAGAGKEWSDSRIADANFEQFLGADTNGFGAGTDTLTLTSLPVHDLVTVTFDLYLIRSWDGNGPAGGGPDNWRLGANGANVATTNFANFGHGNTQSYSPATPNGLGHGNAPGTGAFETNHLGFGTGDYGDTTYRLSYTFASSSSSLVLAFTSLQNQAPDDEGWGLDNVTVRVSTVPEPGAGWLLALGAGGLALVNRRSIDRRDAACGVSLFV